ncbi:hypothetical protein HanRHA438_Chr02g0087231 [Helianthus annuus]|nr:hypothetical protein HanIR_Chr02g0088671 [Helianthus annuus]KAJ0940781.1 hypothetical protein HanRHA438_Chr02g0087231 [Helianthus annuus]
MGDYYHYNAYEGGVEALGSILLIKDFSLLLLGSATEPLALTALKIPDPLIPVLDPSSAANWEIKGGPALESLNLFETG